MTKKNMNLLFHFYSFKKNQKEIVCMKMEKNTTMKIKFFIIKKNEKKITKKKNQWKFIFTRKTFFS